METQPRDSQVWAPSSLLLVLTWPAVLHRRALLYSIDQRRALQFLTKPKKKRQDKSPCTYILLLKCLKEFLPCTPWYSPEHENILQNNSRSAAASGCAQSLSSCPHLASAYHTPKVHLCLQRWTKTYVLIETSSIEMCLTHSWFYAYCPPPPQPLSWAPSSNSAGTGTVDSVYKASHQELSHHSQNGINTNTVFGFSIYCW